MRLMKVVIAMHRAFEGPPLCSGYMSFIFLFVLCIDGDFFLGNVGMRGITGFGIQ